MSRKRLWNKHMTTARKGWHLAAFLSNKTERLVDPRPESYCLTKENAQRRRLRKKKQLNSKFSTWAPFPTLQILLTKSTTTSSNIRRLRTAPGSPKIVSSSFPSVFWVLSSTSIFLLLSHRFSFQVNKTCWKSPQLNKRFLSFFGKNEFGALILSVFEKNLFFGVWKNQKTFVTSFFRCFFEGKI